MRAVLLLIAGAGLFASTPSFAATPAAFDVAPVSDLELSTHHGKAMAQPIARIRRTMADADSTTFFRLTADINRTTFDNWFANEGAILIVNNLLLQR